MRFKLTRTISTAIVNNFEHSDTDPVPFMCSIKETAYDPGISKCYRNKPNRTQTIFNFRISRNMKQWLQRPIENRIYSGLNLTSLRPIFVSIKNANSLNINSGEGKWNPAP